MVRSKKLGERTILLVAVLATGLQAFALDLAAPIVSDQLVFSERAGLVAVEAEHFFRQEKDRVRRFYRVTGAGGPEVQPDGDPPHLAGASGGAYLEVLPDTRRTHGDKLIRGENFAPQAGEMTIVSYRVHFTTPGRYYVWVRAFSTGTEDNGLHVGLDGRWPESGRRMQWTAKRRWFWDSKQRTKETPGGVPGRLFLDVETPGEHVISFSMREDGFEFDKCLMTTDRAFARPEDAGPDPIVHRGRIPETPHDAATGGASGGPRSVGSTEPPRGEDGAGTVAVTGELKQWHKVTLTLDGPYASERDDRPNPFIDCRMSVEFRHESGSPEYVVPGYFAADGNAAETSAESGTRWRAHLSPDVPGRWDYRVRFSVGERAAIDPSSGDKAARYDGVSGSFVVDPTDKAGRDLRAHGRLEYVGQRYLRFAGSGEYFLKAGADAPETLLGYADFDGTVAGKPARVPLKTWASHVRDWRVGDPVWQGEKGKGLIGAINYLSGKGCNAFSFLTYNAGGDGDNVWPFVERNDKLHYDCSKLDQWGVVFDHGTRRGMYLHFKLQENENDDNRKGHAGKKAVIPESLDGGRLGPERKLYLREMIARFGHNLALNWNLGEESTHSNAEHKAMLRYLARTDPYGHNRVLHTFPDQQKSKYQPLLGDRSELTGLSLQNSAIRDTHRQTVYWIREAARAGRPLVVAFDESGSAAHGQPPDLGFDGFDGRDNQGRATCTEHEVRRQTLWGTLMAGGAGVEYYFGYLLPENDLVCENWRSRDRSWDSCRIALDCFRQNRLPFWEMASHDALVDNPENDNSRYCFAKPGEIYLVYLPHGGQARLDLSEHPGDYTLEWFNPRQGGPLSPGRSIQASGKQPTPLGRPPADPDEDWLALVRKRP